ncbi:MAG: kelch repeat-containing protein, partial [Verrucomicrobiota bacterium]
MKIVTFCVWLLIVCAVQADITRGDGELDILFPGYNQRDGGRIAYDAARDRLVRFGGETYLQGDPLTSEWDGLRWHPVETEDVPPIQEGFELVYDAARGHVMLFGGNPPANETWLYDGVNWTNANPTTRPPPRYDHQMVYDSARQRVVLFGGDRGRNACASYGDTWEWDGTDWLEILPATSPHTRFDHQMVFDSVRNRTILYKGRYYRECTGSGASFRLLSDMWEYDGINWTSNTPPSLPASTGLLVFNPQHGNVELFGWFGSSTFELFSYDTVSWSSQTINSSPGTSGLDRNLTYINNTGTAVYVNENGTWVWNPSTWDAQFKFI